MGREPTASIIPSRRCPSRRRAGPAVFCRRTAPPGAGGAGTAQRSPAGFAPEPLGGRHRAARPNCATSRCHPGSCRAANRSCRGRRGRAKRRRRRRFARARTRRAAIAAAANAVPAISSADQNLAEMAQRLEAALRRPAERDPRRRAAGRARAAASPQPAPPRTAVRHRLPPLHRRLASRIWKTRWHHCWAVRRPLREIGVSPA